MAAPKHEIIQTTYQNPHATKGLRLNMLVVSNTSDEDLKRNIKESTAKYPDWIQRQEAHDGIAVLIGGGASIEDDIDKIVYRQRMGGTVIAMNGASRWARGNGIPVDWQVIVDAKEETASLVDSGAKQHFFASQCNKETLEKASNLTLINFAVPGVEDLFPPERVEEGGYVLIGGGSTAGSAALALAYSQGFREFHIFGYDSSYAEGKSHAYDQPMNQFMPTVDITWGGKTFETSVAMKAQAEGFLMNAKALKDNGCKLYVHGEGLLQTIYNTKYDDLTEREKYQLMWKIPSYRHTSPGEGIADFFAEHFKPEGLVIDYGCGTGRGSIRLKDQGLDVLLVDFTDNCRDEEALLLPFIQADLTEPLTVSSPYGFCTDVMEHIPTEDVEKVITNIMSASKQVFFQISTINDHFGAVIDSTLHLTVQPHAWWKAMFTGYTIEWESEQESASLFYIKGE